MTHVIAVSDFAEFREAVRPLLARNIPPQQLRLRDAADRQALLFDAQPAATGSSAALDTAPERGALPRVPRRYLELAEYAALFRSADRFELLYRVLYRLTHGEPQLLEDAVDPDVRQLGLRAQSVRKDEHRMHAFLRFRRCELQGQEHFVAWYAPEHHVLRLTAPFFQRRFGSMRFAILTPDESAFWDLETLSFGPGAERSGAPAADELEALFRTYYNSTYNPARANLSLFRKHIIPAFARHMPELSDMPQLMREHDGSGKLATLPPSAAELLPPRADLPALRTAAVSCQACEQGQRECQTVFGEGPTAARLCLIGEQPGEEEDRTGRVFIGPAGQVLNRALAEAGIERDATYLTNAVKHYGYELRGKRRIHKRPHLRVIQACKPWLEAELEAVSPRVIVCLGASAAQSLLGPRVTVSAARGQLLSTPRGAALLVTYHPSAVLRAQGAEAEGVYRALVSDLTRAQQLAAAP